MFFLAIQEQILRKKWKSGKVREVYENFELQTKCLTFSVVFQTAENPRISARSKLQYFHGVSVIV